MSRVVATASMSLTGFVALPDEGDRVLHSRYPARKT